MILIVFLGGDTVGAEFPGLLTWVSAPTDTSSGLTKRLEGKKKNKKHPLPWDLHHALDLALKLVPSTAGPALGARCHGNDESRYWLQGGEEREAL